MKPNSRPKQKYEVGYYFKGYTVIKAVYSHYDRQWLYRLQPTNMIIHKVKKTIIVKESVIDGVEED